MNLDMNLDNITAILNTFISGLFDIYVEELI